MCQCATLYQAPIFWDFHSYHVTGLQKLLQITTAWSLNNATQGNSRNEQIFTLQQSHCKIFIIRISAFFLFLNWPACQNWGGGGQAFFDNVLQTSPNSH